MPFVVEDVVPPWQPRAVRFRRRGEALSHATQPFVAPWGEHVADIIRIFPAHIPEWGRERSPAAEAQAGKAGG
ncbi:MAG TPA: hypothetical protein VM536_01200 [Chloroflexia bacterium]|nr:hypothetical protein [Chloroflexia bacterium]